MRRVLAVGLLCASLGPASTAAQRAEPTIRPVSGSALPVRLATEGPGRWAIDGKLPIWVAPVASAVLPGAGQAMLHQQRLVAYLAVEGFVWLQYFKDLHDWREQRAAYRDLAAQVARSPFTGAPAVGGWDYYERMEHYLESGVYSLNGSTTSVEPESDESTYNGAMWLLARRNFWPDPSVAPPADSPDYVRALQFYENRAIRPEFRWSWRNAQLEQDLYRRRINKANDAVRRATSDLGILLANHVLSAVDAFAALQLRAETGPMGDVQLAWHVATPFQ